MIAGEWNANSSSFSLALLYFHCAIMCLHYGVTVEIYYKVSNY